MSSITSFQEVAEYVVLICFSFFLLVCIVFIILNPWAPTVVKVVMWSRGLTWQSQVGANPIPLTHPTNLALFGHKITLYRFNHGAHTIARGSNRSRGL